MTPPTVLLDQTFLAALVDPAHESAADVVAAYRELVEEYVANVVRLRARRDHLAAIAPELRRTLLSPVQGISVAHQFRRAAQRLVLPVEMDEDERVTLVVMRRERIDRIATLCPAFAALEVQRYPATEPVLGLAAIQPATTSAS